MYKITYRAIKSDNDMKFTYVTHIDTYEDAAEVLSEFYESHNPSLFEAEIETQALVENLQRIVW